MADLVNSNYDGKKYKCAPWHGQRGAPWQRIFKDDFENVLMAEYDTFSNLHQWLNGTDIGGWAANAQPHPAGGGQVGVANIQSIQSRKTRGDRFLSLLKSHILSRDIHDAINARISNNLIGAAPLPVAQGGPGGAAVANTLPS